MRVGLNTFSSNYSENNISKTIEIFRSYFNINFGNLSFSARSIRLDKYLVKRIRDLRDNKCILRGGICNKIETGGIIECNISGECSIISIQNGEGDTINIFSENINNILFHTHPNAYGIWNKASPPSEFDIYNSFEYATQGINKINLIWDAEGIYIYYIYPGIVKQLEGLNIQKYRDELINILRWTKMGFGFYYKNRDYASQYSSFSQYRNLLKTCGIYVDYKTYDKKIKFLIPKYN